MANDPPDRELRWLSAPKQARSQQRLRRILEAAEFFIVQNQFEQTSVADIMARAGSSVGVFYQRFKTKDDLLRCLMAQFTEDSIATADQAFETSLWNGRGIPEIIETLVPFLVGVYRARRGLLRAVLLRASVDSEFVVQANASQEHIARRLHELLMDRKAEIQHPDPAVAIQVAYQSLRSTLNMLALFEIKRQSGFNLDDPRLEPELVRSFLANLGIPPASTAKDTSKKSKPSRNQWEESLS